MYLFTGHCSAVQHLPAARLLPAVQPPPTDQHLPAALFLPAIQHLPAARVQPTPASPGPSLLNNLGKQSSPSSPPPRAAMKICCNRGAYSPAIPSTPLGHPEHICATNQLLLRQRAVTSARPPQHPTFTSTPRAAASAVTTPPPMLAVVTTPLPAEANCTEAFSTTTSHLSAKASAFKASASASAFNDSSPPAGFLLLFPAHGSIPCRGLLFPTSDEARSSLPSCGRHRPPLFVWFVV